MNKQEYKKILHRSMPLIDCQNWDLGERIALPKVCKGTIYFDPIFVYKAGRGVSVYYNFTDPRQGFENVVDYFNSNTDVFYEIKNKFVADCEKIINLAKRKDFSDFEEIFQLTVEIWPFTAIMNILGDEARDYVLSVKKELILECQRVRSKSEKVLYLASEVMANMMKENIPADCIEFVDFLKFEEIKLDRYPSIETLKERSKGFIFHKGELTEGSDVSIFASKNNFEIFDESVSDYLNEKNEIKGSIAFRGMVQGIVRIILEKSDLNSLKEGEVLITSMTTPDFISGMKKASAFVTDEGGITCHASIVAREMKKPCVIGTKIATKFFKNGDLVEVDADNGFVRIIKKA